MLSESCGSWLADMTRFAAGKGVDEHSSGIGLIIEAAELIFSIGENRSVCL